MPATCSENAIATRNSLNMRIDLVKLTPLFKLLLTIQWGLDLLGSFSNRHWISKVLDSYHQLLHKMNRSIIFCYNLIKISHLLRLEVLTYAGLDYNNLLLLTTIPSSTRDSLRILHKVKISLHFASVFHLQADIQ